MKTLRKCLLACLSLLALAACGGGDDLQDRLDVADPAVRFVHASAIAPNLTLFRADVAQADATDVPYKFASNYFDIDMGVADWSVKTADGALTLGSVSIDPVRGDKYTLVALPGSSSDSSIALIVDPYNKPLTSESTRIRVMNASFNASSIDLYLNAPGTNIDGVNPLIAATAYKTAGPASGSDSMDVPGGSYQLTITAAGTKTVLFSGPLAFGNNQDVLLLTVPDSVLPGSVKVLEKIEGTPGTTEVPAS
jgi:hypothetical protein